MREWQFGDRLILSDAARVNGITFHGGARDAVFVAYTDDTRLSCYVVPRGYRRVHSYASRYFERSKP